jgi:microcystin-dependent protein
VATSGDGRGHDNMAPFLALTFIIALQGLFPSRN